MKSASVALQAFLATSQQLYKADLYRIVLADGAVLLWTDFDIDVTVNGSTYLSSGPPLKRSRIQQTIGLEVATLTIELLASPLNQIPKVSGVGTYPVLQALAADRFAGAWVTLERLYMPNPTATYLNTIRQFRGRVADVRILRSSATLTVKSIAELLDYPMPRHLIQPSCNHILFGTGCGLVETAWRTAGTITGGDRFTLQTSLSPLGAGASPPGTPSLSQNSSNDINSATQTLYAVTTYTTNNGETIASPESTIVMQKNSLLHIDSPGGGSGIIGWNAYVGTASGDEYKQNQVPVAIGSQWVEDTGGLLQGSPPPLVSTSGFYALGVITFTSGVNAGLKRSILGNTGGTLNLKTGLPQACAVGDAAYVTPGDDKTKQTCQYKFQNLIHFAGYPHVPPPESVI